MGVPGGKGKMGACAFPARPRMEVRAISGRRFFRQQQVIPAFLLHLSGQDARRRAVADEQVAPNRPLDGAARILGNDQPAKRILALPGSVVLSQMGTPRGMNALSTARLRPGVS